MNLKPSATPPPPASAAGVPPGLHAGELLDFRAQSGHGPMMAELYRNAEALLRKQQRQRKAKAGAAKAGADSQRLLHEVQVHQVELEMQNAELQEARDRMEALLEKYTDLYDFAPVGYFTLAAAGTIRQVNLTGAHLVGVERSHLAGRSFGTLVCAAQRPVFNSFLKQVFADQAGRSIEVELLNPGQPPRIIRIKAQRAPAGEECRVVLEDITELKREADKVRVSEVRYRRLFEAAHDGVLLLDPDTRKITDANPFMTRLLDYPREQLVGKELFKIGLLQDETASREMFEKLKRQHEVRYEDLPLKSRHGRQQEVEVVANLYQENGHAVIQCNIRDITARKAAEAALSASEQRFRAAVGVVSSLIWTNNAEGLMTGEQPGWGNFTGQTLKEYQGYGWARAVHPQDAPPTLTAWKQAVAGKKVFEFEHRLRRRDGEWRLCSIRAVPLFGAAGEIREWVGVHTDITERKQAEAAQRRLAVLAASNRKLELEIIRRQAVERSLKQSEQHQRGLLAQSHQMQEQLRQLSHQVLHAQEEERKRVSRELHDVIAQTLTGINLRLAALKKTAGHPARNFGRNLARTQRLVEKSVNLVHEFARELRPAVLDDLGLIPALHSFLKLFSKRTRLHVALKVFAGVEQLDGARRTILYRVAQEALTNVARHAQASRVEVSIQKSPQLICLKIKDDGKSFSVARSLNTKGGKRLGLLGMRERLEMVGGSFEIESSPGNGTTVTAQIPLGKIRGGGDAGEFFESKM